MRSKYDAFKEEDHVWEAPRYNPSLGKREYVPITCPFCSETCFKIPVENIYKCKSTKCLQHLRVCPVYNANNVSPPTEAPPTKRPTPNNDAALVTIYALVLVPEDRLVYTGRTSDPDRRLAQHARRSSQCRLVRNAFKKHGRKNFRLDVLMRCHAADAKANETAWIIKNNTLHPNGYNLMHGATAGEESNPDRQIVPTFAGVVPFEGEEEEIRAFSDGWADVAEVLEDGNLAEEEHQKQDAVQKDAAKNAVDAACRALLKETHPDRAGSDRTFTSTEVAALVNSVRASMP